MARNVTLFTGQWADLPIKTLAPMAKDFGYDGVELACWGDHFDVERAAGDVSYCDDLKSMLAEHGPRMLGGLKSPRGPARVRLE